jgi:hypothetical protein
MRMAMRIKTALLGAVLLAAPLQAQQAAATADDARAVIAAVLAHQASIRGPEGAAQTCVAGALAGPPAAPGAAAEDDVLAPDHSVRIYFQWHVPDAPAPARAAPPPQLVPGQRRNRPRAAPPPPPPAALAAAEAERLNALRMQAAAAPPSPAAARVDPAAVPEPLRIQGANDDCALITLSTPAFAGDAAFVEFAYACGTVCGNGGLYALQRREGRWELAGIADIWIR